LRVKQTKLLVGFAAWASLIAATSADAHQDRIGVWTCKIANKQVCGPKACTRSEVTGWSRIDFGRSSYSLCTERGCVEHPARIIQGRGLITIDVVSKGLAGRISGYDEFVEIASTGAEVSVSHGSCVPSGH
jgi:hypothetical protein